MARRNPPIFAGGMGAEECSWRMSGSIPPLRVRLLGPLLWWCWWWCCCWCWCWCWLVRTELEEREELEDVPDSINGLMLFVELASTGDACMRGDRWRRASSFMRSSCCCFNFSASSSFDLVSSTSMDRSLDKAAICSEAVRSRFMASISTPISSSSSSEEPQPDISQWVFLKKQG